MKRKIKFAIGCVVMPVGFVLAIAWFVPINAFNALREFWDTCRDDFHANCRTIGWFYKRGPKG